MKANVRSIDGSVVREMELPSVFEELYRPDLIKKAVLSIQSTRLQPHGAHPFAGIRSSAVGWGSGRGASHVPRLKNGSRAAKVPQAKGGREAHPPVTAKILVKKINKQEKWAALRSAIAATAVSELVAARGHRFEGEVPLVVDESFETLGKTTDVINALTALGVYADVERAKESKKVRAGRGKMRGRRYKQRKSLLIVTGDEPLRAARNLAGIDAVSIFDLDTEMLAPGTHAGRLTLWTESALKRME
ncbi:50S ribosomal protein L4P [Methanofollis liminatans DSM 4140]|jgi:large subunit ribosomal protein L4e|uniref:Large ribosomal subunit protein uL4 n=1 Tax=Methanofollis liminatans DSM 4140 TaxID=28892 RepID=J0S7B0_9EURY|nr:50S ribosomal protein L4 [Methanofollis liminatans]EJG06414.1 50S ribosomal protein L4P [Methanofollis liminatans DSM 4140]